MSRTIFQQVRLSRLPEVLGLCQSDVPRIAQYVNEAIQRLLFQFGEDGPFGAWARVVFLVSRLNPFITLPPVFARAIGIDVCRTPIPIRNQFYETLVDGTGLRNAPPQIQGTFCGALAGYERGNVPTLNDLPATSYLRLYPTDPADYGRRLLVSGALDQNGLGIYSQDGLQSVNGFYLTLKTPFDTSPYLVSGFSGIAKDLTQGDILLVAVDPTTGVETALSRYGPDETTPSYRRYYFQSLPQNCCSSSPTTPGLAQVTAMCKYEYAPVRRDTDFLIIGNIPALLEECMALRYGVIDEPNAAQLEVKHHRRAVQLLQAEIGHQLGQLNPAVNQAIFGSAKLACAGIGTLT